MDVNSARQDPLGPISAARSAEMRKSDPTYSNSPGHRNRSRRQRLFRHRKIEARKLRQEHKSSNVAGPGQATCLNAQRRPQNALSILLFYRSEEAAAVARFELPPSPGLPRPNRALSRDGVLPGKEGKSSAVILAIRRPLLSCKPGTASDRHWGRPKNRPWKWSHTLAFLQ
jgi:hypothetical protein